MYKVISCSVSNNELRIFAEVNRAANSWTVNGRCEKIGEGGEMEDVGVSIDVFKVKGQLTA